MLHPQSRTALPGTAWKHHLMKFPIAEIMTSLFDQLLGLPLLPLCHFGLRLGRGGKEAISGLLTLLDTRVAVSLLQGLRTLGNAVMRKELNSSRVAICGSEFGKKCELESRTAAGLWLVLPSEMCLVRIYYLTTKTRHGDSVECRTPSEGVALRYAHGPFPGHRVGYIDLRA